MYLRLHECTLKGIDHWRGDSEIIFPDFLAPEKTPLAKSISICDKVKVTGSRVSIYSYPDPNNKTYITETDCACRAYVDANREVQFDRWLFETSPESTSEVCHQEISLWRLYTGERGSICHTGVSSILRKSAVFGCLDRDSEINIIFQNSQDSYAAAFVIDAYG